MARLAAQLLCLALVASFGGRGAAKTKMSRARREAEARVSRCLDLGFTDALECSVCDDLFDATDGDPALDEECRSCCRSSGGPKAGSTTCSTDSVWPIDSASWVVSSVLLLLVLL